MGEVYAYVRHVQAFDEELTAACTSVDQYEVMSRVLILEQPVHAVRQYGTPESREALRLLRLMLMRYTFCHASLVLPLIDVCRYIIDAYESGRLSCSKHGGGMHPSSGYASYFAKARVVFGVPLDDHCSYPALRGDIKKLIEGPW
jgi:hypothetical protein